MPIFGPPAVRMEGLGSVAGFFYRHTICQLNDGSQSFLRFTWKTVVLELILGRYFLLLEEAEGLRLLILHLINCCFLLLKKTTGLRLFAQCQEEAPRVHAVWTRLKYLLGMLSSQVPYLLN